MDPLFAAMTCLSPTSASAPLKKDCRGSGNTGMWRGLTRLTDIVLDAQLVAAAMGN